MDVLNNLGVLFVSVATMILVMYFTQSEHENRVESSAILNTVLGFMLAVVVLL